MNDNLDNKKSKEILKKKIEDLTIEHRDLDEAIALMIERPSVPLGALQRMKKRKLAIKDEIRAINKLMLPDIIA